MDGGSTTLEIEREKTRSNQCDAYKLYIQVKIKCYAKLESKTPLVLPHPSSSLLSWQSGRPSHRYESEMQSPVPHLNSLGLQSAIENGQV